MKQSKILIVEDEVEIAFLIKKYLEKEGYAVSLAEDGMVGLEVFKRDKFDLVITDIMMPNLDGVELCKKIRKESIVPIMFLTAKDEEVDRLIGLMLGGDDYVTKPFSINEVVARVKAILRRYLDLNKQEGSNDIVILDDLFIDLKNSIVKRNDEEIHLRVKELKILELLAKTPGKVFSKSQIFESVWESKYLGDDNTVMVHMRRLRKKIEVDPNNPKFIKTLWGLGYKFAKKEEK